ncbi:MAG: carboxypeptidase-like regulatory domain-containing protein [Alkalispirochaeta sp.]
MKRSVSRVLFGAVMLGLVFTLSGCEWLLTEEALSSISGYVVDGRTGGGLTEPDGVDGVTVTLTRVGGGGTLTATTDSDGRWSTEYEDEGEYRLTASKSGWFFVPQDVNISGWLGETSDVVGIETGGSKGLSTNLDSAITFILVWNENYEDIDGRIHFTAGDGSGFANASAYSVIDPSQSLPDFTPYYDYSSSNYGGFGPDTNPTNDPDDVDRIRSEVSASGANLTSSSPISHSNNTVGDVLETSETVYAVQLDRDDRDGSGPEVITVNTLPVWEWWDAAASFSGGGNTGLPDGSQYMWTGVMEYYVYGWSSDSSTINTPDTPDSDHYLDDTAATVYVVQGSDLLGEFPIPSNVNARELSVVRMNTFTVDDGASTYFQIVPEIRDVDGISARSMGSVPIGTFGPGRAR